MGVPYSDLTDRFRAAGSVHNLYLFCFGALGSDRDRSLSRMSSQTSNSAQTLAESRSQCLCHRWRWASD